MREGCDTPVARAARKSRYSRSMKSCTVIRTVAMVLALAGATLSQAALALGLGAIAIDSALNEPLRARITLRALQSGDVDEMTISLGTAEQFARAGVERPFHLSSLRFEVLAGDGEGGEIQVTTREPVVEPFLNFLIEVSWPRGRVIREYTVLLDPPVYGAAISETAAAVVSTVDQIPDLEEPAATSEASDEMLATGASDSDSGSGATLVTGGSGAGGTYGPVRETDTLWSIASRERHAGTSIQRMMLAILATNASAFSIDNINALRAGAILRIPSRDEMGADNSERAMAAVAEQHAAWQDYRRALGQSVPGAAVPTAQETAASQAETEVSGDSGTSDSAASTEGAGDTSGVLKVVAAGSGESIGADEVESLRKDLNMALEEADSKQRENEDLAARLGEAELLIADLQRLIELKDDDVSSLQQQLAAQSASESVAEPEPVVSRSQSSRRRRFPRLSRSKLNRRQPRSPRHPHPRPRQPPSRRCSRRSRASSVQPHRRCGRPGWRDLDSWWCGGAAAPPPGRGRRRFANGGRAADG